MEEEATGAEIVLKSLTNEGVDTIFGIPGGVLLGLYDELFKENKVRHILMRHEQCAAHAADGYARASGRPGVCLATSGPGATNLVTGLATANIDSVPIVAMTGQVLSTAIGTDAFQEADTFTITMPVTKHNFLVKKTDDLAKMMKGSFMIANSGRKGAVLIDLPTDVLRNKTAVDYSKPVDFPGYKPNTRPNATQIKKAADALAQSARPLIIAGGGVLSAGASDLLEELAEFLGAGVITTLMGKGAFPEDNALSLGMAGMHGRVSANTTINHADVLLCIGTRFSDRLTGWRLDKFAPGALKIHADLDASEINKLVSVDVPIVGDAKLVLEGILKHLKEQGARPSTEPWSDRIKKSHQVCEGCRAQDPEGKIHPRWIIQKLNEFLDDTAILTTEVGQCQMFAAHYYTVTKKRTFISSGGLGTMGFGFPAAIGAKVAMPDKQVVDVAGDGSFLMTCQDLATCVENDIPVVVIIFDNRYLGMVRQWQELFYDKRYAHTDLGSSPDFVKLAEAFGAYGERVEKAKDFIPALERAFASGKPAVIDVIVGREDNVIPMIPPGGQIDKMIEVETCRHT